MIFLISYYGHPWADINGPEFNGNSIRLNYHMSGAEKTCTLRWNTILNKEYQVLNYQIIEYWHVGAEHYSVNDGMGTEH